jgi:hypothetical protein
MAVVGVFLVWVGLGKLHQFGPYATPGLRGQQMFPGSVIAMGIVFMLIPLLPSGKWVDRLIRGRQTKEDKRGKRARRKHNYNLTYWP